MYLLFSRISNLIYFFLIIYFIPIVIGPLRLDFYLDPRLNHLSQRQMQCFNDIHDVFKVDFDTRQSKREYYAYAISNMRYLKNEESRRQNFRLEPGEEMSLFLLFDAINPNSTHGYVVDNEYVYNYYGFMSDKFVTNQILTPSVYCGLFPGRESACRYAIEYYGFPGEETDGIILHAFSGIALFDIRSPYPWNPDLLSPEKYFGIMYMNELATKIQVKENEMKWPEEFCQENYA